MVETEGWDTSPGDDGYHYIRFWIGEYECYSADHRLANVTTDEDGTRWVNDLLNTGWIELSRCQPALWLPLPTPVQLIDDRRLKDLIEKLPSDEDMERIETALSHLRAAEIDGSVESYEARRDYSRELIVALSLRGSFSIGIQSLLTKYKAAEAELKEAHDYLTALGIGTWTRYRAGEERPKAKHVFSVAERIRHVLVDAHNGDEDLAADAFGLQTLPHTNPRYKERSDG